MGKLTISMAIFNSKLLNYQRVEISMAFPSFWQQLLQFLHELGILRAMQLHHVQLHRQGRSTHLLQWLVHEDTHLGSTVVHWKKMGILGDGEGLGFDFSKIRVVVV